MALVGIGILSLLGRWYKSAGHAHPRRRDLPSGIRRSEVAGAAGDRRLIALIFSKFFYLASITSYYTFYLMHRFDLPTQTAQIYLFVFLAAAAAGTFIGGPVGDGSAARRSSGFRSSASCRSRWRCRMSA